MFTMQLLPIWTKGVQIMRHDQKEQGASQDVNIIVWCKHKDCPYCHEGECGKEVLYWNDAECRAITEGKQA
jgi:hypothetical protein